MEHHKVGSSTHNKRRAEDEKVIHGRQMFISGENRYRNEAHKYEYQYANCSRGLRHRLRCVL